MRHITTAAPVNQVMKVAVVHRLSRVVERFAQMGLLCLVEFGYVHPDSRGVELLFQVLTVREERASIAVASNASFSGWASLVTSVRLAAVTTAGISVAGSDPEVPSRGMAVRHCLIDSQHPSQRHLSGGTNHDQIAG